jgi:hypothetical protein
MRLPAIVLAIAAAFARCGSFSCADAAFATYDHRKDEVGSATAATRTTMFVASYPLLVRLQKRETTSLLHAQKKPGNDPKSPKGVDSDSKVNYVRIFSPLNPYMVRQRFGSRLTKSASPLILTDRCPTSCIVVRVHVPIHLRGRCREQLIKCSMFWGWFSLAPSTRSRLQGVASKMREDEKSDHVSVVTATVRLFMKIGSDWHVEAHL